MPFSKLHPTLSAALAERGYAEATAVQRAVIEADAQGRDLLVSAQTGSGKTVAFGLAMAETLLEAGDLADDEGVLAQAGRPLALVVAPTRELALQVQRELVWLYAGMGARVSACVGGMDMRAERRALAAGAHVVVGTPGRLRDHVERESLDPADLRVVVLDEADEMLDLGFREDLEAILDATPVERRTLLFSATLPREILGLATRYQRDALRIAATEEGARHGDIEYRAVRVAPHEREHAVVNILRYFEAPGALVFCHTREAVRHLHGNLVERGFAAVALSGELSQSERSHALQALRDGRARVCVATDVAARGLDLPDLGLVIQVDLPREKQTLLHRSGRTGRAGRKGTCVLLVPYNRARPIERMLHQANVEAIWSAPPAADQIRARDQERLLAEVAQGEEPSEEDRAAARALLAQRPAEDLAAALVRLHRARLPAPEELFDETAPPRPHRSGDGAEGPARAPGTRDATGPAPSGEGPGEGFFVWFRMNVGQNANADPRWLIPVICRRGNIGKKDIGAIRILERETQFEIAADVAQRFSAAMRRPDDKDRQIRFEPVTPKAPRGAKPAAAQKRAETAPKKKAKRPKG